MADTVDDTYKPPLNFNEILVVGICGAGMLLLFLQAMSVKKITANINMQFTLFNIKKFDNVS